MRQVNGVYTQRFNRRHERCGHVLQGRFGARLVDDPAYLHEVCRYIVLNPVRAGLVVGEACRAAARDLEIPRAQRFATRPTLSDLFAGAATRGERNTRAVAAVLDHGYTMKAVADFLGRHYVTVSRALASVGRPLAREKMSECKT